MTYFKSQSKLNYLSIIYFIFVVNINRPRSHHTNRVSTSKQPHQIKEVAALFYQSPSRVNVKPVPIVDLLQAWFHKMNYNRMNIENSLALHTLTKKGKRCSRIATILTCPRLPPFTISISLATGGMYLYSSPT